jgi:hypothetical protein
VIALTRPSLTWPASVLLGTGALLSTPPLVLHLSTATMALALGFAVLLVRKGTPLHRLLGRTWVGLMTLAALSSFWLTGLRARWSVIHLLRCGPAAVGALAPGRLLYRFFFGA